MAPVGQIVLIKTSVTLTYRTKCVDKNLCNPDKYWNYRGLFFQKTIFYVREKTRVIEKIHEKSSRKFLCQRKNSCHRKNP
jgi:hypothetical protein